MTEILVTFARLHGASQDCRTTAARIESQLSELKAGVQRVAKFWDGAARDNYRSRQAEWDRSAADLNQVLQQISAALEHAGQDYQNTERQNAMMWL
jgi:WXG100 family type VII secretion target